MKPAAAALALVRPYAAALAAESARPSAARAATEALAWAASAAAAAAVAKHMKKLLSQIRAQMTRERRARGGGFGSAFQVSFNFDDPDAAAAADRTSADLLRCVFGTRFGPLSVDPAWQAWQARTIPKLAQAIYEERAFDRLPILADALEEAGCTNSDILNHCRGPGPHVRGCFVVDLILSKDH
jgi:hypothetical protein